MSSEAASVSVAEAYQTDPDVRAEWLQYCARLGLFQEDLY